MAEGCKQDSPRKAKCLGCANRTKEQKKISSPELQSVTALPSRPLRAGPGSGVVIPKGNFRLILNVMFFSQGEFIPLVLVSF